MRKFLQVLLFLGITLSAAAQDATLKGLVTSQNNTPLTGATIELNQTTLGTTTDNTGAFELNRVPAGAYRLSISYVGFQTRYVDVSVSANSTKDLGTIQLVEAQEMLGVVSINGKKHNKFTRETSVSVSKMPLADIENPQVYNTITSSLLEEQIVTNFDDALKNAPGIDKLWESTGRGNDGAGYYSLRGFAVQPTLVNGLSLIHI